MRRLLPRPDARDRTVTGRKRWRPPWPVQLAVLFAAMAAAGLAITAAAHLILGGPW